MKTTNELVVTINDNEPTIVAEFRAAVALMAANGWDAAMVLPRKTEVEDDATCWLLEDCETGNKVQVETCSNEEAEQALARLSEDDRVEPMTAAQIASQVIAELKGARQDVVADYKAGQRDFVFVEETTSWLAEQAGYEGDELETMYLTAAGVVFDWLRDDHGVKAPEWYTDNDWSDWPKCSR